MKKQLPALNSRILELINVLDGGNVTQFANRLKNVSQQRLNRIFGVDTRTSKIPYVHSIILTDIADALPEVNIRWLLTGEGEMLKSHVEPAPQPAESEVVLLLRNLLKESQEKYDKLFAKYVLLEKDNEYLKKIITETGRLDNDDKNTTVSHDKLLEKMPELSQYMGITKQPKNTYNKKTRH
jgi:hypothetical protein